MLHRTLAVFLLSLALTAVAPAAAIADSPGLDVDYLSGQSAVVAGLAPGDRTEWAAMASNTGVARGVLAIEVTSSGVSPLMLDPVDGLQVEIITCDTPLVPSTAPDGARTFGCSEPATLYSGPVASLGSSLSTADLVPARSRAVRAVISLPSTAGNGLVNLGGEIIVHLSLVVPDAPVLASALPFTGADAIGTVLAASGTFLLGLILFVVARRRRSTDRARTGERP